MRRSRLRRGEDQVIAEDGLSAGLLQGVELLADELELNGRFELRHKSFYQRFGCVQVRGV